MFENELRMMLSNESAAVYLSHFLLPQKPESLPIPGFVIQCLQLKSGMFERAMFRVANEPCFYFFLSLASLLLVMASKRIQSFRAKIKLFFRFLWIYSVDTFLFFFTASWLMGLSQFYGCWIVWRYVIAAVVKLRYWSMGEIATGLDSAGSLDEPESRQIIKSVKILGGKCDIEELRRRVDATVSKRDQWGRLKYPKFHQQLFILGGFYCWKPANFDIRHHVRFIEGMDEDSESLSESSLLELVSKESNKEFADGRALWEILVVPRVHYDHETKPIGDKWATILRISHGIGDGFSFLKLTMREMAGESEEYVPPSTPSNRPFFIKACIFLYLFFKSPRAFYSQLRFKDENVLHNSEVKMTGKKVHVWSQPLDVAWLKELKKRAKVGMSTILLETLSASMRKYMISKLGVEEWALPQYISSMIPVPAPNHPSDKLVNKFSIVMLPLEVRCGQPLDRCRQIEAAGRKMARSPDAYMNLFLMDLLSVFPLSWAKYFIINKQCTTVISNLPGPTKQISIWGYPLMDTMFWLPNVGSSGISVSYLSYENKLRFALAVDTGVIKDGKEGAQSILNWMIEDLRTIAQLVDFPTDNMFYGTKEVSNSSLMDDETLSNDSAESKKGKDEEDVDLGYGSKESTPSPNRSSGESEEDEEDIDLGEVRRIQLSRPQVCETADNFKKPVERSANANFIVKYLRNRSSVKSTSVS